MQTHPGVLSIGACVTVGVYGGLGNQLFQYATGRAVALANDAPLLLNTQWYRENTKRAFLLPRFAQAGIVLPQGIHGNHQIVRPFWRLKARMSEWRGEMIRERNNGRDRRIARARKGVYLDGYWQVPDYFEHIEDTLRRDLTITDPPSPPNQRLLDRIARGDCVSVHVRRGDFVSNPAVVKYTARCTPDYYRRAARLVSERCGTSPAFVLFSDDPEWARENIALPGETLQVTHNEGASAHEDLRLMAACRHNIIANSTFSWWGAWLNPNPDKIVVAPRTWYLDSRHSNDWIVPREWVKLDPADTTTSLPTAEACHHDAHR